jgi:hypothetical protein
MWSDIPENLIRTTGTRYIIPESYRTLRLNIPSMRQLLETAPMEFTAAAGEGKIIVSLPMPDGTYQRFTFWESPTMAPELQAKFPEIRTYTGQGIEDPYATLKMDLTPHGFHAQILSPNGRVFIDPYSQGDTEYYISYYTRDYHKEADFECEVFHDEEYEPSQNYERGSTGPQLRTYRLACAATGEYTQFHGGTVTTGLAAVNTSVNRVNGVYEREVAVRMVLIGNNNLIIYTNASTDPYTNTNGSTMLTQNINNLSSVIGNSNFDIGHVFSTGGGGVAYLGSVCGSSKAGGVTGSPAPIGDPFDIDYVAHEMGHQFGGNHTFNGNAGNCSGSNRNAATAYEPGSGSTIMAYAGICSPQDLQPNSDPYFHVASFEEIRIFTNTGNGNGCAVITNTGNSAPSVTVPAGGFYIPKSTPFSLTGSATDPNGDALTYCWEEFDLGVAGAPTAPVGDAPIFRTFNPVTSSTRIFPKVTDLVNNTSTIGELLPTYGRLLKFKLTVRDNRAAGGGVNWGQVDFTVDGNSGPFVVNAPNTAVTWSGNSQQTVTWSIANTNLSPVSCSNVKISLSTDGGYTWGIVLNAGTPNDGSEAITVPNISTSQARVKVEAVNNIFFDISNTNFTIQQVSVSNPVAFSAVPFNASRIDLTFTPNASNNNVVIVWNNTGTFTTPSGVPPSPGSSFAGGTLLYNGVSSPQSHTNLTTGTTYFYKAFSYNGSSYSSGLTANAIPSVLDPAAFSSAPSGHQVINLTFTPNTSNNNVIIVWNLSGTFTTPSGTPPASGNSFAGGTLLYNGTASPQVHSDLTAGTRYYYKAFSYNGSVYSSGLISNSVAQLGIPVSFTAAAMGGSGVNLSFSVNPSGNDVIILWNTSGTFTAPSGTPPSPGSPFAGGTLLYNGTSSPQIHSGLTAGTRYYYRAFSYNGSVYSEGVNQNAMPVSSTLYLTTLIEGLYNGFTTIRDTITVELRENSTPYLLVESKKMYFSSYGTGSLQYNNVVNGQPYYIVIKHRNAVETWSAAPQVFSLETMNYDFTTSPGQAYGGNLVLKGSKWCLYSGDVDQDGIIDIGDLSLVFVNAVLSIGGYVATDINGNNLTDAADVSAVYNNNILGKEIKRPADYPVKIIAKSGKQ